jgi:acid phosphatase family membrane protein YuiD
VAAALLTDAGSKEKPVAIWLIVFLAAVAGQLLKVLLYSVAQRRLVLAALGQSAGLPSVHASVGGSLLTLCAVRFGWQSPEAAFALVFLVITVFDAMRVRAAAQEQRYLVYDLVRLAPAAGARRRRVVNYLDIIAHTPVHVAAGLVWGFLFALACETG